MVCFALSFLWMMAAVEGIFKADAKVGGIWKMAEVGGLWKTTKVGSL